jgi:flagellar assembly protein FliH
MLIRSGKFTREPLVLAARRFEVPSVAPQTADEPPVSDDVADSPLLIDVDNVSEDSHRAEVEMSESERMSHSDPLHEAAGAGVAVAALSYTEYKERFEQELEALREQAIRDGYREGEELARQALDDEFGAKLRSLAEVIAAAQKSVHASVEGLHEIGAEIVYEAVTKIAGSTLASREGVQAVVREVVKRAKDSTRLTVHVSPSDYEWISKEKDVLLENLGAGTVDIVPDERVQLGGCLLETPSGNLDGRLEVQLQCLRDALLSARSRRLEGGNAS